MKLGNELASEHDKKMIANHTGEVKFTKMSNQIDIYVGIYLQIKENIKIIEEYQTEINKINKKLK